MLATRHFTKHEVEGIASGDFDGDVVQVGVADEQADDRRNAIRMSAIIKTRDDGLFYEILYEEGVDAEQWEQDAMQVQQVECLRLDRRFYPVYDGDDYEEPVDFQREVLGVWDPLLRRAMTILYEPGGADELNAALSQIEKRLSVEA